MMTTYLVWFDPLFEDHFALPETEATEAFLGALEREHIHPSSVQAEGKKEAIEKVFPDRHDAPRVRQRMN